MAITDNRTVDCPHRIECGACSLLRQPYPAQLDHKRQWLLEALVEHVRIAPRQVLPTLPSPLVMGYRNRAKLTISSDRERHSTLGYFRRRNRRLVSSSSGSRTPQCGASTTSRLRRRK